MIIVQKYGGTSVETAEARRRLAARVCRAVAGGCDVVVVVSAMGRRGAPYATDTLLDLVRADCPQASERELGLAYVCGELLSTALVSAVLQAEGLRVAGLTGWQAGVITNDRVEQAAITEMRVQRVLDELAAGRVVVVAGSQGATAHGAVTTLGRGGSDTTACALGVALDADAVEIYTDTPGIMTADPRLVAEARTLSLLSHRACLDLARLGAKVMHPEAVRIAASRPMMRLSVCHSGGEETTQIVESQRLELRRAGPVGVAVLTGDPPPDETSPGSVPFGSGCTADAWSRVSLVCEDGTVAGPMLARVAAALAEQGLPIAGTASAGPVASLWVPEEHAATAAREVHRRVIEVSAETAACSESVRALAGR